jgi:CBS domain containing-hemolysin-like protein
MVTLLLGLLLTGFMLYAIVLLKTYRHISNKELKRQARQGDKLADSLYRVVGFGASLDIILWFVVGVSGGLLFAMLAKQIAYWLSAMIITAIIWLGFAWLPNSHSTKLGRQIASLSAKPMRVIIDLLYPLLSRVERIILKHTPITVHTGLYEKQDLVELLKQQKGQLDNRISKEEIAIARNALTFGDKLVRDVMTPRRVMKSINASDSVGPVTMEELHKSGHSRFPVYEDKKDNFVGILYMRDMVKARAGGLVKSLMESKVFYVHDESNIDEVLQAFIKTHHHLFLVVNNFEEIVGLITMEDILEEILGQPILDEFDQYDSLRAVATKLAQKEHKQQEEVVKTSPKATGVIE